MTFLEEKPNGENSNRSTFERLKKGRYSKISKFPHLFR